MPRVNDPRFFVKLRSQMMRQGPFFANLMFKVEYEFTDQLPTAGTDGYTIFFNPAFMDLLSERAQLCVLGHEIGHAAWLHAQVMKLFSEDKRQKANIAGDFLVNALCKEIGICPEDVAQEIADACGVFFLNAKYNPVDYSLEKLMKELPDDPSKCKKIGKEGRGSPKIGKTFFADVLQPGKQGQGEKSQKEIDRENEMREAFVQAVAQQKKHMRQQGKGQGWFDKFLSHLLEPKIDWKKELFEFVKRQVKNEISWKRPNRRYLPSGLYMPVRSGLGAGTLGVAIDLSGSIGQEEINIFFSELSYIFECLKPEKVVLVGFDDGIRFVQELEELPTDLKIKGGGGTDFVPVFKKFDEYDIEALVFMTDMYGPFPKSAPNYPVLFVSTSDVKEAPFGRVVPYQA